MNFLPRADINTARRAASETSHGVLWCVPEDGCSGRGDALPPFLCAAEKVREQLPVSGWTFSCPYIYSACLALVHFKSLSFKFSWKLSDHKSYEKRFLRSLSNLLSSHCPRKKVNICGHIWKMHDSPIICLPSPNGSFAVPGLFAAFANSWLGLSQSKYLQLGKNTLLPPSFLDGMFALREFAEYQGSTQTSQDKISLGVYSGSSYYFSRWLRKFMFFLLLDKFI